jgi:hypothetical protein
LRHSSPQHCNREDQPRKAQHGRWHETPQDALRGRDVTARADLGKWAHVGPFPDDNAAAQPDQATPAGEMQKWVVELVVRENVFEVVILGIHQKLTQGPKAWHAHVLGVLQPLDGKARHIRQAADRVVVAVDRLRLHLRGEIGELVPEAERQVAPAVMFVGFHEFDDWRGDQ